MPYLYLILSVFGITAGSVFGALYNRKNADKGAPTAIYNLLLVITAFLCWGILWATDFSFDAKVLWFAIPMGACYATAAYTNVAALKYGPVSLTSLFLQLSLIGVTVWGFFFWGEKATVFSVVGLVLAVCSLVLCLYEKKSGEKKEKKVSVQWLILASLLFLANAGSTILQRTQQTAFDGQYAYPLMFFCTGTALIVFLIIYLKSDKTHSASIVKTTGWMPVVFGVANVGLNLFVMLLATSPLSPSLVYSVISVGGLAVSSLASAFLFKERLYWWQWVGMALGALSVAFLSV